MMSDLFDYHFNRGYNKALEDVRDKLVSNSIWSEPVSDQVVTWDQIRDTLEKLEKDDE